MADNENVVATEETEVAEQSIVKQKEPFSAKLKEWNRKNIVNLKKKPQNIGMLFIIISTLIYLLSLGTISQAIYEFSTSSNTGISMFIVTLLSIIVVVAYMNSFPKRKKPNIFFIVLVFVMLAVMVVFDVYYYSTMSNAISGQTAAWAASRPYCQRSCTLTIVHIVFVCLSAVALATLPLYKKLIMKINTRKELDTTEMKEAIDLTED